jgi:GTPase KRas
MYFFLSQPYFREGQGFILVYSIASRATFENVTTFYRALKQIKQGELAFMLVGTQCDRTYKREVSKEEGMAAAQSYGCEFIEVSAKTGENVEELFINLVRLLRQTKRGKIEAPGQSVDTIRERKSQCAIM